MHLLHLLQIHFNIMLGGVTFESAAAAYNATHNERDCQNLAPMTPLAGGRVTGREWVLSKERLEEAWFLWRLVKTAVDVDEDVAVSYNGAHRKDIEAACEHVMTCIFKMPSKVHLAQLLFKNFQESVRMRRFKAHIECDN